MSATAEQVRPAFTSRPIRADFGLEITGLDISRPLDPATVAAIRDLSEQHKVLVFKGQSVDTASLGAFAGQFGATNQEPPAVSGNKERDRENNIGRLGTRADGTAPLSGYALTARHWHTDSSWRPVPTWLTILAAGEIPDAGGNTAFADMGAAWEGLSPERKALCEGKQMVHSWRVLRHYEPSVPAMGDEAPPPVCHPLVRTIGGRKSLFLNGHVCYYVGNMPQAEGEALFKELLAHATQPQYVYEHVWSLGDVVMWDDRTTLHKVMDYDRTQRRVMYRAEVIGTEAP